MLYSCFDPTAGDYRVYETANGLAINADLAVPSLPSAVGKIGVPSIEAARPLPAGARLVGRSWNARGIVVRCGMTGLAGDETESSFGGTNLLILLGGAVLAFMFSVGGLGR